MSANTEKKSGKSNAILSVIGIILCVCFAVMLVSNCILIVKSFTSKDEVPGLFNRVPLIVLTESMDPTIQSGDLIFCKGTDPEEVKVGDVIAFYDPAGNGTTVVTHRVTAIEEAEDGTRLFTTKGDANNVEDSLAVSGDKLVGVYTGTRIAKLGNVAMFMQTTAGLIICVVCPLLLLMGYDVLRRKKYEKTQRDDTEALMKELEELRKQKAEKEDEKQ